jgi:hypothetical protein
MVRVVWWCGGIDGGVVVVAARLSITRYVVGSGQEVAVVCGFTCDTDTRDRDRGR